nr:molybdopterin-dependent oxidoreductase [Bacillota bacterium]
MTNSVAEVHEADVIFLIGSNPTEAHPVMGAQIRQARQRGAKLIVADPRVIDLAKEAEVHLQLTPGTNIALLNGMMHVIISEGLMDKEFVENKTEGFEELWDVVKDYSPEKAAEICGIDPEDLRKAARLYAKGERAPIYYCLGVTEHATGTAAVMSISNLALLCGNVGKYGAGVNPLRGQNNVQGACDMGAIPNSYSGYQKVADPEIRAKFSQAWGVELPSKPGLTSIEAMN